MSSFSRGLRHRRYDRVALRGFIHILYNKQLYNIILLILKPLNPCFENPFLKSSLWIPVFEAEEQNHKERAKHCFALYIFMIPVYTAIT